MTPTLSIHLSRGYSARGLIRLWARDQAFIHVLRRTGFRRWLAGTDAFPGSDYESAETKGQLPMAFSRPGLSLQWEVILLAQAGLSPLEALQAATLGPAEFFGATDSLGTVATGKLADLVLLGANPLADIHHISTARAVLTDGRYYDRAALDALDPEGAPLVPKIAAYEPPPAMAEKPGAAGASADPSVPARARGADDGGP